MAVLTELPSLSRWNSSCLSLAEVAAQENSASSSFLLFASRSCLLFSPPKCLSSCSTFSLLHVYIDLLGWLSAPAAALASAQLSASSFLTTGKVASLRFAPVSALGAHHLAKLPHCHKAADLLTSCIIWLSHLLHPIHLRRLVCSTAFSVLLLVWYRASHGKKTHLLASICAPCVRP